MPDTNSATATPPVAEKTPALPNYEAGDVLVYLHENGKTSPLVLQEVDGNDITFQHFQGDRFSELCWPAEHLANNTRKMSSAENAEFITLVGKLQGQCQAFIVALREGNTP